MTDRDDTDGTADVPARAQGSINYGVQQFGGTSHVGNQAVGPRATVTGNTAAWQAPAEVAGRLADLERLLDEHDAELPAVARSTGTAIRATVATGSADPQTLSHLLGRLAVLAAPVPAIVEAAQAIQGLLS